MIEPIHKANRVRGIIDEDNGLIYIAKIRMDNYKPFISADSPTGKNPWQVGLALEQAKYRLSDGFVVIENGKVSYLHNKHPKYPKFKDLRSTLSHYNSILLKTIVEQPDQTPFDLPIKAVIYKIGYDVTTRVFGIYQMFKNAANENSTAGSQVASRICCFGKTVESFAANWASYQYSQERRMILVNHPYEPTEALNLPYTYKDVSSMSVSKRKLHDILVNASVEM